MAKVTKKKVTKKKTSKKKTSKKKSSKKPFEIQQVENPKPVSENEAKKSGEDLKVSLEESRIENKKEAAKKKKLRLTAKQRAFADNYLKYMNKQEAAKKAGYSAKSAHALANETLKNPNVTDYIEKTMDKRAKRTGIDQDKVVNEIAKVAFSDMTDIATWGGYGVSFKASDELSKDVSGAIQEISSIDTKEGSNLKVKLHPKLQALELLGKHLKLELGKQRSEINHGGSINVTLENMSDEELEAIINSENKEDEN